MEYPTVIIRKATPADVEAVVGVWKEMMEFHRERDAYFESGQDAERVFAEYVVKNIRSDDAAVFVAEYDGSIVGFCQGIIAAYPPVYKVKEYGMVCDMAVTAANRRSGVGTLLFGRMKQWFADRGMTRIELHVAVCNEVSTRFWKKMGLRTVLEARCLDV